MGTQPIHTEEQHTDPQVRARLMAACDTAAVLPVASLRQRLIRAARAGRRACRVR
jgi:hypothetical protein